MFQDLPPVKGAVEPSLAADAARRIPLKEVKVGPMLHRTVAIFFRSLLVQRRWRWRSHRAGTAPVGVPRPTSRRLVEPTARARGRTLASRCRSAFPNGFTSSRTNRAIPILIRDRARSSTRPPASRWTRSCFRASTDLKQAGADQPLAVFDARFDDRRSADDRRRACAPGDIDVPRAIFATRPATTPCASRRRRADVEWTLHVVAGERGRRPSRTVTCSTGSRLATARSSAAAVAVRDRRRRRFLGQPRRRRDRQLAGQFTVARHHRRLHRQRRLPASSFTTRKPASRQRGLFEGRGPLAILLIVFVGGLALNLTPCVLPMIPINLAIIGAGTQAGSRGRGFLLGGVYGAAMALVYGVLGLVVILTAGTFGTINASPWFNLGIAVLFVVLALAMFDVITIDFSRFRAGLGLASQSRGTFARSPSAMGAVAALLAGACVAPVVIQVVLFSSNLYANGHAASRWRCRFFLGVGMAMPWPIAGAGLAALPKPGAWMVRVKQVFGVIILATAPLLRIRRLRALREPLGRCQPRSPRASRRR